MSSQMSKICVPLLDCFYTVNGRLVSDLAQVPKDAVVQMHYRLRGGKGGFGSMLRAIGSQIEKTTNHEMCRDLSGRRMRDVNMELKLKEWYAKASDREREKMEKYYERRRKRQEMLAQGPLPGHKFSDREYERQKRKITYELQGALDTAIAQILGEKLDGGTSSTSGPSEPKRTKLWIERLDGETSSSTSGSDASEIEDLEEQISSSGTTPPSVGNPDYSENAHFVPTGSVHSIEQVDRATVPKFLDKVQSSSVCIAKEPVGSPDEDSPKKPTVQPLTDAELNQADDAHFLESYGLDVLKESLVTRGLKCGGTIQERAARLFSIRGLQPEDYPARIRAKPK